MDEKLYLTDLISAQTLQRIQDAFSAMTGMAALTTDSEGIPVTKGSNFSDFCIEHIRKSEDGHIRCEQCDKFGAEDSWSRGCSSYYYCHAGLIDFAAPILADKQMVGSFIGGQILTEAPERGNIYQIAWELGIDPQGLWEASKKIRIISEKGIDDAAQFLFTVANALSDMAYAKYRMLQANQDMERANNLKSVFLSNMSHEIRTPMNAVIGMAEMALREELSPVVREYIRQIKISSKALLAIINDILDFSKIESGKMDILPVEYETMSVVNDITNIAVELLKEKDVELIIDISADMPFKLKGDDIRIKQIILNLLNNAAKFTQKGQVVLRLSHSVSDDGKAIVHFEVEDTGIGIREKDLRSIFESFSRVDSIRNRNIEGTGLGLAITQQLVQLMGGSIEVSSQYGVGTVFSFDLPQEIVDVKPSCHVNNPEKIIVMGMIKNDYVNQGLASDCAHLGVDYRRVGCAEDIKLIKGKRHFLFVENELFTPQLAACIKDIPELNTVILYKIQTNPAECDIKNLRILRKPLYLINEVNIFNGEEVSFTEGDAEVSDINFIAPSARVLVVDDNVVNLVVTQGLLKPLHMKVDTATGGQEAIDMLCAQRYDIIFMDHMMPNLDGVETTHIIRRVHPEYDNIPIIALTANAMSGSKEMFLSEGMNDFISKPIEVRNLIKKVAKWLPDNKIEKMIVSDGDESVEDELMIDSEACDIVVGDLNTKLAIQMMGSEELYWSVLKNYYRMIEQKAEHIKELENNEDWENYTIEVHSLKSTSRQIGALALSNQAADMEKAGNEKNSEWIHACTDAMLLKYKTYIEVLAPFCEELKTEGSKRQITKEILLDFFRDLELAIEELDMDKMEDVNEMMRDYSFDEDGMLLFERLSDAIDNIDVDECGIIMDEWKKIL